jgi:hypothetical protein
MQPNGKRTTKAFRPLFEGSLLDFMKSDSVVVKTRKIFYTLR